MNGVTLLPELPSETWPAISIYIPTTRATTNVSPDRIRLKDRLADAAARLEQVGLRRPEAAALLQPAQALLHEQPFWQHRADGLAVFVGPELFRPLRLPIAVPERTTVGHRFDIRPLLPLNAGEGHFFLLAIAAGQVQLLDCSRAGCSPVDIPNMPRSVGVVSGETDYDESLQYNPIARQRDRGSPGVVKTHGLETPEELRKAQLIEYLRRIDAAVTPYLKRSTDPLLLSADPEILGNYRAVCSYKHLYDQAVATNPFAISPGELHARAYGLLAPRFRAPVAALRDIILARLGSAEPTVSLKLEEILHGAAFSRVAGLLLADGAEVWGRFDPEKGLVEVHGTPSGDDEDLLNYAAVATLANGGQVFAVTQDEMPQGALAAAALRY
jgi:hypothetical protein